LFYLTESSILNSYLHKYNQVLHCLATIIREAAMACNNCEVGFQSTQSLVVSVTRSGTTITLTMGNQGRNILLIRRVLLCLGGTVLYLRYPDGITWMYPSTYLEPGTTATYYIASGVAATAVAQAQAEYIEIEGRARSCVA